MGSGAVTGTGDSSKLVGSFQVKLTPASDLGDASTTVVGKVYDGPTPTTVVWEHGITEGACTLTTPRIPFCTTPCGGSAACVEDDTCLAYPMARALGTVTVTGIKTTGGAKSFTMSPISNNYQPGGSVTLAYPPFAEGDAISVAAAGDYFAPFSLSGVGIAPLALSSTGLSLSSGQPLSLVWTKGADSAAKVHVKLDISHHGGSKGQIECEAPDTGALGIPAALLGKLLDLGVAGFPTVIVSRHTTASTVIAAGRVDLEISSVVERAVDIDGLTSCTDDEDCSDGQICQTDLSCRAGAGSGGASAAGGGSANVAGEGGGSSGGAGSSSAGNGGSAGGGLVTTEKFSFFVTSFAGLQRLAKDFGLGTWEDGFGGDLKYGETGAGAGLRGADKICATLAETSMSGAGAKGWRAFLSAADDGTGKPVNAIDRIGAGPWYDRLGRLFGNNVADIAQPRPASAHAAIKNDFPNEDGVPNHQPDPTQEAVDNHDMLTGSTSTGKLLANSHCLNWTSGLGDIAKEGKPRVGHSWPRGSGDAANWMSSLTESGCKAGANLKEQGGPLKDAVTVGSGGGYGGFYCFALKP